MQVNRVHALDTAVDPTRARSVRSANPVCVCVFGNLMNAHRTVRCPRGRLLVPRQHPLRLRSAQPCEECASEYSGITFCMPSTCDACFSSDNNGVAFCCDVPSCCEKGWELCEPCALLPHLAVALGAAPADHFNDGSDGGGSSSSSSGSGSGDGSGGSGGGGAVAVADLHAVRDTLDTLNKSVLSAPLRALVVVFGQRVPASFLEGTFDSSLNGYGAELHAGTCGDTLRLGELLGLPQLSEDQRMVSNAMARINRECSSKAYCPGADKMPLEELRSLVANGHLKLRTTRFARGNTLLHLVSGRYWPDATLVRRFIVDIRRIADPVAARAVLEATTSDGDTALHGAVHSSQFGIVRALVEEAGADAARPDTRRRNKPGLGETPYVFRVRAKEMWVGEWVRWMVWGG